MSVSRPRTSPRAPRSRRSRELGGRRQPGRLPRAERPTLTGKGGIAPDAPCGTCSHPAREHASLLPSPCDHGREMPLEEIFRRCGEPELTLDPRYGCRCLGWSPTGSGGGTVVNIHGAVGVVQHGDHNAVDVKQGRS